MADWVELTGQKTWDRFERNQERAIRNEGHGAVPLALKITEDCLPLLMDHISNKLEDTQSTLRDLKAGARSAEVRTLLTTLKKLPPQTIAMCGLGAVLHGCGTGDELRVIALTAGSHLNGELWAAKLLRHDKRLAGRIEKAVRKRHSRFETRMQAARSIAKAAGYTTRTWTKEQVLIAGGLLVKLTLDALPHVFYTTEDKRSRVFIHVQEAALSVATAAVQQMLNARPVMLPCVDPPLPWTGLHSGGYPDERVKGCMRLLRKDSKLQSSLARAAIRDGSMQPVLDAVNTLQAVPWKINTRILEVIQWCADEKVSVRGLPRPAPFKKPPHPKPWEDMSDDEQRAWKYRASKIEEQNRGLITDRVLLVEDLGTASLLADEERFFTPFNADWRGRVYPLPFFNFQRDDRVRALFLFANGVPIGDEGLFWLKVHLANCGDFGKISKRPLEERVRWVDDNWEWIELTAANPFESTKWREADKPFLFLAAVMELAHCSTSAIPAAAITHLPCSFDGTCSGLQHLSAMTRAPEGSLVNLTPSPTPQDVYQTVADAVRIRISADASSATAGDTAVIARRCLDYGIDRGLVKRSVMTFPYSSKKFGMAKQFGEDLMRPLEIKVLAGDLETHPFGDDNGRGARTYLAGHVYEVIKEIVSLPAEAMGFLQAMSRALAHEGKPMRWTTPAGLPVVNAYYEPTFARVRLWLHNATVRLLLAVGDTKEIDKNKASNGVSPNFVHSMDGAHLQLTVNAAAREGITNIATVHDSFGCLAPQATRFNQIIREQFVAMYSQHDVLVETLEQAKRDLTQHNWHRLPDAPQRGSLNIEEVKDAVFAFA